MSAPTSPESVKLQIMPDILLPEDDEFLAPDMSQEGVIGYLAIVENDGAKKSFSVSVEERTKFTHIHDERRIKP